MLPELNVRKMLNPQPAVLPKNHSNNSINKVGVYNHYGLSNIPNPSNANLYNPIPRDKYAPGKYQHNNY